MANVYGYLRVSTIDQCTEKNKHDVLAFANDRQFNTHVGFVEEQVSGKTSWKNRKLKGLVDRMQVGDILIVPELSRLGRSLKDVLDVLDVLTAKDVEVYSVKENQLLNGDDINSKVMRTFIGLFAEIASDIHSQRVKEGMAAAKRQGQTFGRPKGNAHSKLDDYEDEIVALLKNGSTKKFIANRYGCTAVNLYHWLKTRGHQDVRPTP